MERSEPTAVWGEGSAPREVTQEVGHTTEGQTCTASDLETVHTHVHNKHYNRNQSRTLLVVAIFSPYSNFGDKSKI